MEHPQQALYRAPMYLCGLRRAGEPMSARVFIIAKTLKDAFAFARRQRWRPAGRLGWQMSDGAKVHYIHLLEQIQAVKKNDIVYDAGGVQGETERLLKRRGAIIKR